MWVKHYEIRTRRQWRRPSYSAVPAASLERFGTICVAIIVAGVGYN